MRTENLTLLTTCIVPKGRLLRTKENRGKGERWLKLLEHKLIRPIESIKLPSKIQPKPKRPNKLVCGRWSTPAGFPRPCSSALLCLHIIGRD